MLPFPVPDFSDNALNFKTFSIMLATSLLHIVLCVCVQLCSFYSQFLQDFYHERMLHFVKTFFSIYRDHVISLLRSTYTLHYIYQFVYDKLPMQWWKLAKLIMMCYGTMVFYSLTCIIFNKCLLASHHERSIGGETRHEVEMER